jgi:hypothetical protein
VGRFSNDESLPGAKSIELKLSIYNCMLYVVLYVPVPIYTHDSCLYCGYGRGTFAPEVQCSVILGLASNRNMNLCFHRVYICKISSS